MWKNAICKQLNFKELLVDFLTIIISVESSKAIQKQIYNYNYIKAILSWSKIVKIMSTDKGTKVMLIYTLQVVEKKKFKYKHHGPLLVILDNIK